MIAKTIVHSESRSPQINSVTQCKKVWPHGKIRGIRVKQRQRAEQAGPPSRFDQFARTICKQATLDFIFKPRPLGVCNRNVNTCTHMPTRPRPSATDVESPATNGMAPTQRRPPAGPCLNKHLRAWRHRAQPPLGHGPVSGAVLLQAQACRQHVGRHGGQA